MSNRGRGRGGFYGNNGNRDGNYQNHGLNFHQNQNNNNHNSQNINQFVSANSVPVEIGGWNGASMEDCVKFISRKCRIVVLNPSIDPVSGNLKGYVRSEKDAKELCNWSGVKFAGQSLKISKSFGGNGPSNGPGGAAGGRPGNNTTIETITEFLKFRYDANAKLLNLAAVQQDPTLASKGFFATITTTSKFFPALMKVADELKLDVESIDLSNNNLNDLSTISTISTTFPRLKNLSLQTNNISRLKTFESWKHKLNFLRELIIINNPLVNNNQINPQDIKLELMRCFPRLIVVNGEVLRNEALLMSNLTFPIHTPKQMFFSSDDIQSVSTNFVTNFFNFWDSNRQELLQLYQNESQFSLSVDMAHPHMLDNHSNQVDFSHYLSNSRNLTKISTLKSKMAKLYTGPNNIMKIFSQLPKSKHELMTKPNLFSMETYNFPKLNGIIINIHGTFQEVAQPENTDTANNSNPRNRFQSRKRIPLSNKSFDRSFIVIPGPNGSMILASDSLIIRNPSGAEAWNEQKNSPQPQQQPSPSPVPGAQPPAQPQLQPQPSLQPPQTPLTQAQTPPQPVPGIPGQQPPGATPTTADLPPDVKSMFNIQQQEILVKVLLETHLTIQYGVMLCEQSNWDYQQCTINFKNSAASLPRDAFA